MHKDLVEFGVGTPPPPPTFDGSITQKALPDGTAEVTVRLRTSNAITMLTDFTNQYCVPIVCNAILGYNFDELFGGANPPLGNVNMQIKFINNAPGAPLPDLYKLLIRTDLLLPNQKIEFVSFTSDAFGPLRPAFGVTDGTPGRAQTMQTGLFGNPGVPNNGVTDNFPVENVKVQTVGNQY